MKSILHVLEKPKIEDLGDLLEMRSDVTAWKSYLTRTKGIQTNECLLSLMNEFNTAKSDSLTPTHIRSLSSLLKSENVPLVLATLEALERLGNAANLPQLRKLVAGDYSNSKNSSIKEVALQCLQTVERRVKVGMTQATLLRPAPVVAEGLLRPSINENSVGNTDGLLRIAEIGVAQEANSETSIDVSKYQQYKERPVEVKPVK